MSCRRCHKWWCRLCVSCKSGAHSPPNVPFQIAHSLTILSWWLAQTTQRAIHTHYCIRPNHWSIWMCLKIIRCLYFGWGNEPPGNSLLKLGHQIFTFKNKMTYLQPNFCRFNSQASEISNLVSTKLFKHCWSFHWGCQLVGTWNKRQGIKGRCELLHIIAQHHPSLAIKCPKTYRRRK